MFLSQSTLDDLLRDVYKHVLSEGSAISPSRGGARELSGVLLELTDVRARLSLTETKGKIFSCFGELFWYLSGTNSLRFIQYYITEYTKDSEDGATIYGGYGPRLFDTGGVNQVQNIIELLRRKPFSRRAVIQIFGAADIAKARTEVPCTCTLQFLVRDEKLQMIVNMRSNDAFLGLPHDVFAFTMLQEIMARSIGREVGTYKHCVGSLHLYDKNLPAIDQYIAEGFQATDIVMPAMPDGDPWSSIASLLDIEGRLRNRKAFLLEDYKLEPYWDDIARVFQVFSAGKQHSIMDMKRAAEGMHTNIYDAYVTSRISQAQNAKRPQSQLPF